MVKSSVIFLIIFSSRCTFAADECFTIDNRKLCLNSSAPGTVYTVPLEAAEDDGVLLTEATDSDTMFLVFAGCLVFFMQTGFALLEAGAVDVKNMQNILFKNLMDASLGAIVFYTVGYGFAYGDDTDGPFIGSWNFALSPTQDHLYIDWFFQYTFAATAATIVSGSVAERCRISAYFVYAICLTLWVYPVVVHWVWDSEGWLAVLGCVDFAGSGVVHLVGGTCGLVGAALVGPRTGVFDERGKPVEKKRQPHGVLLQAVGTTILWFGWYGFNCGSALAISGNGVLVARVAVASTLAAASGGLTTALLGRILFAHYDLGAVFNGILSGLVAICASVGTIQPYMAIPIGIFAGIFYFIGSRLLLFCKIDDPLDAFPVHGVSGMIGLLSAGIFSDSKLLAEVYDQKHADDYISGKLFAVQICAFVVIALWTCVHAFLIFGIMKMTVGIRVDEEIEKGGLDMHEHGGVLYSPTFLRPQLVPQLSRVFTTKKDPSSPSHTQSDPRNPEERRSFIAANAVELENRVNNSLPEQQDGHGLASGMNGNGND